MLLVPDINQFISFCRLVLLLLSFFWYWWLGFVFTVVTWYSNVLKRQVQLLAESLMVQNKVLYGETPAQTPNSWSWIVKGGGNLGVVGMGTVWKVKEKRKGNGTTPLGWWKSGKNSKIFAMLHNTLQSCGKNTKTANTYTIQGSWRSLKVAY